MKLTKEECFKALDDIKVDGISYCIDYCSNKDGAIEKRKLHFEGLKTIEQLIDEYFDNPPLKFEELEEDMLLWDNNFKEWCLVILKCKYPHKRYFDGTIDDSEFEEGRFYRKMVEHDEIN